MLCFFSVSQRQGGDVFACGNVYYGNQSGGVSSPPSTSQSGVVPQYSSLPYTSPPVYGQMHALSGHPTNASSGHMTNAISGHTVGCVALHNNDSNQNTSFAVVRSPTSPQVRLFGDLCSDLLSGTSNVLLNVFEFRFIVVCFVVLCRIIAFHISYFLHASRHHRDTRIS